MINVVEQHITLAGRLTDEMRLHQELARLRREMTHLKQQAAMGAVNLWLVALEQRRDAKGLLRQVKRDVGRSTGSPFDPDDSLSDQLLAVQQKVRGLADEVRRFAVSGKPSRPWRWLYLYAAALMEASHADWGQVRLWLMEHDADVSPVLPETFTSAESLIAALRRDE